MSEYTELQSKFNGSTAIETNDTLMKLQKESNDLFIAMMQS